MPARDRTRHGTRRRLARHSPGGIQLSGGLPPALPQLVLGQAAMSEPAPALHITSTGTGSRTVVFLHGLLGQGKNLASAARSLGDVAHCLLIDAPNHGRSAWTEEIGYGLMADFIADALSERGALDEPVILVGHSMGGKIAMCLTLDHPELVAKLCVVDIAPVRYPSSAYFDTLMDAMADLDLASLKTRGEADEALRAAIPDDRVRAFVLQNLHHEPGARGGAGQWSWRCNLDLLRRSSAVLSGFPDMAGASWDGPVLWIAGQDSDYVRPEFRPAMTALFPRTEEITVPGAGHWVHAEQPALFVDALRDFVRT